MLVPLLSFPPTALFTNILLTTALFTNILLVTKFLGRAWVSSTLIMKTAPTHWPLIDHKNGPRNNGIYVPMSVSFTCVCRFLVTPWNAPCILVYWRAHMRNLQLRAPTIDWTARTTIACGATRVCCEDYWWRKVGECADTWYKWIQPTETVKL